jgi:hypothetical protein
MISGRVRSCRSFISIEFTALNFSKIRTPASGMSNVKTITTDMNQNFILLGKTIEYKSGLSIRAIVAIAGIING